jgi:hypothetical protein
MRPRSLPRCRQRLCPRSSARLRPSRASEPSPLLSFHALPPSTALALSCSACVPLPLYPLGPPAFLSLCALGLPLHALCPRFHCQVCITRPPPGTAGGYTFVERRWRCVKHFLFSCKASPLECPDPTDLWISCLVTLLRLRTCARLHVDSFYPVAVRRFCMPWPLDPFCFLSASGLNLFCGQLATVTVLKRLQTRDAKPWLSVAPFCRPTLVNE